MIPQRAAFTSRPASAAYHTRATGGAAGKADPPPAVGHRVTGRTQANARVPANRMCTSPSTSVLVKLQAGAATQDSTVTSVVTQPTLPAAARVTTTAEVARGTAGPQSRQSEVGLSGSVGAGGGRQSPSRDLWGAQIAVPRGKASPGGGGASAPRFSGHDAAGGAAGAPAAGAQSRGDEKAYIRGPCAAFAQAPQSTIVAPATPRQQKSRHNRHAAGWVIRASSRNVKKYRIILKRGYLVNTCVTFAGAWREQTCKCKYITPRGGVGTRPSPPSPPLQPSLRLFPRLDATGEHGLRPRADAERLSARLAALAFATVSV